MTKAIKLTMLFALLYTCNYVKSQSSTASGLDWIITSGNGMSSPSYIKVGGHESMGGSIYMKAEKGYAGPGTITLQSAVGGLMRMDADGNVGIGTSTPSQKLDVNGKIKASTVLLGDSHWGSNYACFSHSSSFEGGSYALMQHHNGTTVLNAALDMNLHFRINNETKMIIKGNNVGIGTYSPNANLEVQSSGAHYSTTPTLLVKEQTNRGTLVLESAGDEPADFVFKSGGKHKVWLTTRDSDEGNAFRIYTDPNNNNYPGIMALNILQSGDVGIGVYTPSQKLDVNGKIKASTVLLGDSPWGSDYACFSHSSSFGGGSYALVQRSDGTTILNAASNKNLNFRINNDTKMIIKGNNVGIGTDSPNANLEVQSSGASYSSTPTLLVKDYSNRGTLVLESAGDKPTDLVFKSAGQSRVWLTSRDAASGYCFSIYTNPNNDNSPGKQAMTISQIGDVAFYGNMQVKEIKVTTFPTADFVFEPNYKLRSLKEVDTFIKENHHLPEIANADEMVENGLNMATFQIQLLQKIEELTLYMIDQDNRIEALEAENSKLKARTY